MRLNEFADAQAQLDLLRIIIDNTWSAIAQQAKQQKRAEAERKAQAKLMPKSKTTSKASITRIPAKASVHIKKPVDSLMKQQPPAVLKPDPNASKAVKPLPLPSNPQPKQLSKNTEISTKLPSTPYPIPIANNPFKRNNDIKIQKGHKSLDSKVVDTNAYDSYGKNSFNTINNSKLRRHNLT